MKQVKIFIAGLNNEAYKKYKKHLYILLGTKIAHSPAGPGLLTNSVKLFPNHEFLIKVNKVFHEPLEVKVNDCYVNTFITEDGYVCGDFLQHLLDKFIKENKYLNISYIDPKDNKKYQEGTGRLDSAVFPKSYAVDLEWIIDSVDINSTDGDSEDKAIAVGDNSFYKTEENHKEPISEKLANNAFNGAIVDLIKYMNFDGVVFKLLYQTINTLVTEKGIIYGDLRNQIEKNARKFNKEAKFSYLVGDIYFLEGTGPYANAKFGYPPIICDARDFFLEWKICYIEPKKTDQQIKDEKRFQYGVEIATSQIESILSNTTLSDDEKKQLLIRVTASWIQSYAQETDNSNFYHNIVTQIGEQFGNEAKTSDDGSLQDRVLVLKVPELVSKLIKSNNFNDSKVDLIKYIRWFN